MPISETAVKVIMVRGWGHSPERVQGLLSSVPATYSHVQQVMP